MAKASMIAREARREKASARAATMREALRSQIKDPNMDFEEKMALVEKLNKKPRDESRSRRRRRCQRCGRPRGVYRIFGLCRLCLRKAAMFGLVPGLVKSSW